MKPTINQKALNSAAKVLANGAKTLEDQGYQDMYFTAQFWSGGKKQNCIERGDVAKIAKQVRDYVKSEEADTMTVEIFEDGTSKSVYRKKFFNLYDNIEQAEKEDEQPKPSPPGLNGLSGLGEVELNNLVDKRVEVKEQAKDYQRACKEVEELKTKLAATTAEKEKLEEEIKAKSDVERYMGIIGTVFPGLATVFQGTRFANLATTLAGTTDLSGKALPKSGEEADDETQSISSMVSEFCDTLNAQEAGIIHLLFMAFEKDRSQMKRAFDFISQTPLKT